MRTSALILLLLAMLAPRLTAALPHALVCAGAGTAATSMSATEGEDPSSHLEHAKHEGGEHHGGHAEHDSHHSAMAAAEPGDADAQEPGDCEHCGQCDEHCSAVVMTALPQQQAASHTDELPCARADLRAGFSHDLNRPPRTTSL